MIDFALIWMNVICAFVISMFIICINKYTKLDEELKTFTKTRLTVMNRNPNEYDIMPIGSICANVITGRLWILSRAEYPALWLKVEVREENKSPYLVDLRKNRNESKTP